MDFTAISFISIEKSFMFGLVVCSTSLYFSFRENMYACSFSSSISFSSVFFSMNGCVCVIIGDRISAAIIARIVGIKASFKKMSISLVVIVDISEIMNSPAKIVNKNSFDMDGSFKENEYARSSER